MNKFYLPLLFCLLNVTPLLAEMPGEALLLQSGIVYPSENTAAFIKEEISSKEIVEGYYFRILQFTDFPTEFQKKEIQNAGIVLNNYIPYHAYNCAIPATLDRNILLNLKVRSVIKLETSSKLHSRLKDEILPIHAIAERGKVDLLVHCQKNINTSVIREIFQSRGYRILNVLELISAYTLRIPQDKIFELAGLPMVYYIEPVPPPSIKDDTEGRSLHRSNFINASYFSGRHYDGSGVVIALADDGEIGPHIDFQGRVTQHLIGLGGNHGDMTSGICIGAGNLIQRISGMATGAYLHVYDYSGYPQIVDAVQNFNTYGTVITSTSYSQGCNEYTTASQFGDQVTFDNPQLQFVFSAGNDGTTDCGYGAGSGWGNITGGYKNGKNVLACGNVNSTDVLDGSSSHGPAPDGRIKPDICANGLNQRSTDEGNTYQIGGGTSAAAPGVAGVVAQLYHAYKDLTGQSNPPSSLIKAALLNAAEDLGNSGPDYKFGWGRLNAFRAVKTLEDQRYLSDSVGQGQTKTHTINVPPGVKQLRVMIYWHDIAGTPLAAKSLVNDLNMELTDPANTTFTPWVLNPAPNSSTLNMPAIRGVDSLNNVEQITIDSAQAGVYTVSVSGFQIPLSVQKYHLVYEFRSDSIQLTFPMGGEGFVTGEAEIIRWDTYGDQGNFTIRYSSDAGGTWNTISTTIPGSQRHHSWNVPNLVSDRVLFEVSRNGFSDMSDTFSTIIRTPANLNVTFACPDSIGLAWNTVTGATGYTVSMLGNKYMDDIGYTTGTSFVVQNTNPLTEYWFSVKAHGPNGGKGSRANALRKPPGIINCSLAFDGSVNSIINPVNSLLTDCQNLNSIPVTIFLQNTGTNPIANFNVNYSVNNGIVTTETFSGSISPGNFATFNFIQPINLSTAGTYNLKIWHSLPGDLNAYNDTMVLALTVLSSATQLLNVPETFDSFNLCSTASDCELTNCSLGNGWINQSNNTYDDIDWITNTGNTPSTNTGPASDHTGTPGGKYVYLEASGSCTNKTAMLLSPCFDLSGVASSQLTFWYHMYGSTMGELHVDVVGENQEYNDVIPVRTGNGGNSWRKDSVSLSAFTGQKIMIRFRGITGSDYFSDMALDDIMVTDLSTYAGNSIDDNLFTIFPNPGMGVFNYFTGGLRNKNYTLTVENIVGKIILERKLSFQSNFVNGSIDLSGEAEGVYIATFKSDSFSRQVKLIKLD